MKKFDPAAYIASLNIDSMRLGLTAITNLLLRLGNPQNSYKTILIAGTNGKGSTAAMIASVLQCAGYKTGLYTSPHLVNVRERIAVNKKEISANDFSRVIAIVKNTINEPATYFEVLTAAAFVYFQRREIDIAVLEVGLGGRLDATNVCHPLVSVITNIGFDHKAYLGNSLTAIAGEKAGIIRQRGVCVTAVQQKKVIEVLDKICLRNKASLYRLGKDIRIQQRKDGLVTYTGLYNTFDNLTVPLLGTHQLDNAAMALAALEIAGLKGFRVDAAAIADGLRNTKWPARLEIIHRHPLFVVDGAHNPAGISVLCRSLKRDFSYRRLILIFSALADKDYRKMIKKIAPLADQIILTKLQTGRAVKAADIHDYLKKIGYKAIITKNVRMSIARALELAREGDMICAAGSLYLAGELKQASPELVSYDKKLQIE